MFFAIIPLALMDAVVIGGIIRTERNKVAHEMESVASAVKYTISEEVESAATLARSIYTSKYIHDYMNREYSSPLEYYDAYRAFFDDTLISVLAGQSDVMYTIYVDNDTIVNGSQFQNLSKAKAQPWYVYARRSGLTTGLYFYYGSTSCDNRKCVL